MEDLAQGFGGDDEEGVGVLVVDVMGLLGESDELHRADLELVAQTLKSEPSCRDELLDVLVNDLLIMHLGVLQSLEYLMCAGSPDLHLQIVVVLPQDPPFGVHQQGVEIFYIGQVEGLALPEEPDLLVGVVCVGEGLLWITIYPCSSRVSRNSEFTYRKLCLL